MKYKIEFIREQFPAFSEASVKRWAHFENAGGSYMAGRVAKRLRKYAREYRVQPYYSYPASKKAGEMMDESYASLAQMLNVPEDWVHIGPSTTANSYTLSQAFRAILKTGDNIIVTNQDHEANSGYWRRLADAGVEVREWRADKSGLLNENELWPLVDEATRFVAFPHVSNIIGQINPVETITKELRKRAVLSIVDGVSFAPHAWPDVKALGADIYFFSAYKTYGAHQGVMVMSPEIAAMLPNQAHGFNAEDLRKKFNPAGPDHSQVASLYAMGDYISDVFERHNKEKAELGEMTRSWSELQRKWETKRLEQFFDGVSSLKSLKILGTNSVENRVPTISFYSEKVTGAKLSKQMSKHGIMTAGGNFYAPRILEALDINPAHGVLRLSFVHYTDEKEIKKAVKALQAIDE